MLRFTPFTGDWRTVVGVVGNTGDGAWTRKEGGSLLAIGLVLGVGGGFRVARVIQGLLFGVAPCDPITFIGVAALMAAIRIAACWMPAARAARIDPAITMRAL